MGAIIQGSKIICLKFGKRRDTVDPFADAITVLRKLQYSRVRKKPTPELIGNLALDTEINILKYSPFSLS